MASSDDDNDRDVAGGVVFLSFLSGTLTACGFERIGIPWHFGAMAGFFGCAVLIIGLLHLEQRCQKKSNN